MHRLVRVLLLLSVPGIWTNSADASNAAMGSYYVSTTGLDTNPGTSALPFATIGRALRIASPGQTIVVLPGTYRISLPRTNLVNVDASGAPGNPITIVSQYPGQAILDGSISGVIQSGISAFNFKKSAAYITIKDFTIEYWRGAAININAGSDGQFFANHDITIEGNTIDCSADGVQTSSYVYRILIEGNIIENSGLGGCHQIGSNQFHGLSLKSGMPNGVTVNGNTFANNNDGWDVQAYGERTDTTSQWLTIVGNNFIAHGAGGAPVHGNIEDYAQTGPAPGGIMSNNRFAATPTIDAPLNCYPRTQAPIWAFSNNTYSSSKICRCGSPTC